MTYYTGTISTGQDVDMYNALATALTAQGLALVDTVVISTRTHKVWKNAAANNSAGVDWYYDIGYSTSGFAGITIRPFEGYDAVGHNGIRGIYNAANFIPESTYYTKFGATSSPLETSWLASNTAYQITTQSASYAYYLSITPDCISGFMSTTTRPVYAGLMTLSAGQVAAQGASALPLVCADHSGNTGLYQTRYPKVTTTVNLFGPTLTTPRSSNGPQFPGNTAGLQSSAPEIYPVEVASVGTTAGTNNQPYRGILKNLYSMTVDATVGRGDTITDASGTYTINGQSISGSAWMVKQV